VEKPVIGKHLPSAQIDAFTVLARELKFSRAAEILHITQPALTKRIQNLEEFLGHALFLRLRGGLELTETGRILQRHAASVEHQERELLDHLVRTHDGEHGLAGFFRLAGFSSALRSVIVPAVSGLLRDNPRVNCHIMKMEENRLHDYLIDGQVDYCVSLSECASAGIENLQIGIERNIIIESSQYKTRSNCYIDHEPRDNFTERYLRLHRDIPMPRIERAYFDDIYGLIDAVANGIGLAVVPVHLLRPEHAVRAVPGYAAIDLPVILHFHQLARPTQLQRAVVKALIDECPLLFQRIPRSGNAANARSGTDDTAH
jgi:DNA-binding transcriptional LysR family regulator